MHRVLPIVLLILSNLFMNAAWYGHLRYKDRALWIVVLASWGIAFFEYCLQVPANRLGSDVYSTAQLKTIQEVISLATFSLFAWWWLGERLTWMHGAGFLMIAAGAALVFAAR